MPELPEVEIVGRGLVEAFVGHRVHAVTRRFERLRWPIPEQLLASIQGADPLTGGVLRSVTRRSKYLLLGFDAGTMLVHLGMSGTLRRLALDTPATAHDHLDIAFDDRLLRYNDPRRFGAVLWDGRQPDAVLGDHPLLRGLGVEPFSPAFDAAHLYRATRGRKVSIKQLLLSGVAVVGVGNIYASESLFRAGIRPTRAAGSLRRIDCERLVVAVRATLAEAIEAGGSSLRNFVASSGAAGYFLMSTFVYDRTGEPCRRCATPVQEIRQQGRATFFCPVCQPAGRRL